MPYNNTYQIDILQDRNFIRGHAERALWYQGVWCPCTTVQATTGTPQALPDPSQADPTCQACGGTGWLFPNPSTLIHGVVSSVVQDKDLADFGMEVNGELVFSQDPGAPRLCDLDLIVLPDWTSGIPSMGQLVTRGSGASDNLFYTAMQIEGIWTVNPATGVSTSYTPNTDFTWSGKTVTWQGSHVPPAGTVYTVRYHPRYEWSVVVPPMPRYERATDLGQRVVLRKRHIVLQNAPNLIES
jgi:hypothetical protein